ncbi:hypothetical protein K8O96_05680 [Clostridium sporogenes]|uniref:Uncharacterized protein n=1 Tax=Clostridium botulinum TaxID=1491 RepID=A0A6M0SZR9_CLOBO|nr:hypothetical protein [Clostridium sporogenes]NFA61006.1 hypothetical protein [Clostridium botulinum]NFI73601.1 hypothetical protein [Clostridium sporogenes]NFL72943.1 hypothetical protein [Clostridium sporogenes]NFM25145.1 hypothetical protein [Clostridium sporogenes]NFP61151.1 hypothetical protein [Clostridium sporogenes]
MRRIQTLEFKLSLLMLIIISFIIPASISENEIFTEYKFGFPFKYLSICQEDRVDYKLWGNLFGGNEGVDLNILVFFVNVFIIYALLVLIKKIYMKVNEK